MGWLGNALNWVGQTFNPITANQWYAQRSAMNWQSGNLIGKALAITQDSIGGYVAAWTGQSASTAQAWWSLPWTATTFFVGGQAGTFFKTLNMWQGVSTGLCTSANALSGGAAVNPISGAFQIAGLGGSLLGEIAKPLMQATGPVGNSQYMWNLSHLPGTTIESISSTPSFSIETFGSRVTSTSNPCAIQALIVFFQAALLPRVSTLSCNVTVFPLPRLRGLILTIGLSFLLMHWYLNANDI